MSTIFRDQVTVGDFTFNTGSPIDGALFNIDLFDGWNDTADLQVQSTTFGFSDGVAYSSRFPRSARFMEVGGYVLTSTREAAERAMQKLSTIFPSGDLHVTRYSALPRKALAVRSAKIAIMDDIAEQGFRWQTQVMMPWPFKTSPSEQTLNAGTFAGIDYYRDYDPSTYDRVYTTDTTVNYRTYLVDTTSSQNIYGYPDSVSIVNNGNATAYPVISVWGPLVGSSWYVTNEVTSQSLYFTMDISTGSTLVLDTLNRTAKLDGQSVEYFIGGDWPTLPPGSSTIRLYVGADNPTAKITVVASDTWEG